VTTGIATLLSSNTIVITIATILVGCARFFREYGLPENRERSQP